MKTKSKPTRTIELPPTVKLDVSELPLKLLPVLSLLVKGHEVDGIVRALQLKRTTVRYYLCELYHRAGHTSLIQFQTELGTLRRIPLPNGRVRFGTKPVRSG